MLSNSFFAWNTTSDYTAKGFSHREGAKNAKNFKEEVQGLKISAKLFYFPSRASFLRGKKRLFLH